MSFVIIEFPQFICVQLLDMYSPTEAPCRKKKPTIKQPNASDFYELPKLI